MIISNNDKNWEKIAQADPYFGVVSHNEFKSQSINNNLNDFFRGGVEYIEHIMYIMENHFNISFFSEILDFGCGVGRLTIPFKKYCNYIEGCDVSESMLKIASKNSQTFGIKNINFVKSDDNLSNINKDFSLIHSYIVFQHIPTKRGYIILKSIIKKLKVADVVYCILLF